MLKPTFSLTIGGLNSSDDNPVAGPVRFTVERDMDVPADSLHIQLADRANLSLGEAVTLDLGHDGENERVFTGTVAKIRPTIDDVEVVGLSHMNALLNFRTVATFESQSAGSIAQDLIGQAGLDPETVDDGPTLPFFAVDKRVSAYVHLKGLADRLGYELYTNRDGGVMFHALGDAAGLDAAGGGLAGAVASGASQLLGGGGGERHLYGQHVLRAKTRRRPPAWGSVTVGGESPMSGQGDSTAHWLTVNDTDYRGATGADEPNWLVLDPVARTKDLADRFAAGHLAVAERTAYELEMETLGRPQLDLGDSLAVGEMPDAWLNGQGYVRSIRHRFGVETGFVTAFRITVSIAS